MPISTCQEYFDTLGARFVKEASKGVDAIYQFNLTGDGGGTWHVIVKDMGITVGEGEHPEASSTVTAKANDYVKIANNEMNGLRAVMTRRMRIGGNLVLARKMQAMFPVGV